MDKRTFQSTMERIIIALQNAGYDPYGQLTGYVLTGDATFITRSDGARDLIRSVEILQIKEFLQAKDEYKA